MIDAMRRRFPAHDVGVMRWLPVLLLMLAQLAGSGCASNDEAGLRPPAHPFPRWVRELEPGVTERKEILRRFGEPGEILGTPRGGEIYRYAISEIHRPAEDPMRPRITADGRVLPPERSGWDRFRAGWRRFARGFEDTVAYPARQPRPPRRRKLPATWHRLELVIASDGTLDRYRYEPDRGEAWLPATD